MDDLIARTEQQLVEIISEMDQKQIPVPKESIKFKLYGYGVYYFHLLYQTPLQFVQFELSDNGEFHGSYRAYYRDGLFIEEVLDWNN